MLKSAEIRGLFGLYSYDLNFSNSEDEALKFVTGPNGYGKTTLLSFISSLYNGSFDIFFKIPFDSLKFVFDVASIEIRQHGMGADENSMDEEFNIDPSLEVLYCTNSNGGEPEISYLNRNFDRSQIKPNLDLYLSSLSCYYIMDQRLSRKKAVLTDGAGLDGEKSSVCAVKDNAIHLKALLAECKEKLGGALNVTKLVFDGSISEEQYHERVHAIVRKLALYKKFALADDSFIPQAYEEQNAVFLNAFLRALEKAVDETYDFVERLDTFVSIIDSCGLVDKKIEINPRFGFRFTSLNKLKSIIEPGYLSSGEQHITVLAYELLFRTDNRTLVLIDEPEISFHLMWQMKFLENLQAIMKFRNIQCIVATHSPQIFSQNWKLTLDLYKQSKNF